MGTGAFRDASAALERAAALAEENERLTERCRELEKALDESKEDGAGDDRVRQRLEKERDALATELEELRMEHIVNVDRIRAEARQTEIVLNNRIYALEAECTALRDRLHRDPPPEEEPPSEPPLLDDNSKAYLARVTEERDDLRRELRSLREAREAERERDRKTGGLLSRTLNRFLK